ncbi:MAG: MarR family winged helix-turn-helix transcriptional regulator, partial [Bdellovibrionota bacterium]
MTDVVREAGYLSLGTRLKRVGERVQTDAQRILESYDLTIPAGQWPFLGAIERLGALTIGDLAKAVGVTQPGTTRMVGQLSDAGLVAVVASKKDQRRKEVSLTAEGKRLVATGRKVAFPAVERAVRDLCEELTGSLLEQLDAIEDGLAAKSLYRRASSN